MKPSRYWPLIAFAVVALPASAVADARDYPGRLGDGARLRNADRRDFVDHRRDFVDRRRDFFGHRRNQAFFFFVPNTVVVAPSVGYAPGVDYSPPPMAYSPPPPPPSPPAAAFAIPPAAYAPPVPPAPTSPPEPTVVEFDSGRYELRGDGVREPYVWVWVPKPPSAPPGMAAAPRQPATVYRWTDEQGVTTLTDDPNKVPPQFRATEIVPR